MTINTEIENATCIMKLSGKLDATASVQLEQELNSVYKDITSLVIDFSEVVYVSSAGLRVLLSAQKTMNKQGRMMLTHVRQEIMDVFRITGFYSLFSIA